jgi:hypothetical protein
LSKQRLVGCCEEEVESEWGENLTLEDRSSSLRETKSLQWARPE